MYAGMFVRVSNFDVGGPLLIFQQKLPTFGGLKPLAGNRFLMSSPEPRRSRVAHKNYFGLMCVFCAFRKIQPLSLLNRA